MKGISAEDLAEMRAAIQTERSEDRGVAKRMDVMRTKNSQLVEKINKVVGDMDKAEFASYGHLEHSMVVIGFINALVAPLSQALNLAPT